MKLLKWIKINKTLTLVIVFYICICLLQIRWGIPNQNHPFNYQMDEWHQLEAVRNTFTHGTPNIAGSAHGTMFQFILSGVYLIPFVVLHIVNPLAIKSSVGNLLVQERLFEVLRLNTLLFGVLSMVFLIKIVKKYFYTSPLVTLLLFTFTPVWIVLSNFFKYDIALTFWIIFSTYMLLQYAENPTQKNYLLAAIPNALAIATKVSAIPQLGIFVITFFLFTSSPFRKISVLIKGLLVFSIIFLFLGIPDIFFHWNGYLSYFKDNIVSGPMGDSNYLLGMPAWVYLLFINFPNIFGHIFYVLFIFSLIYWLTTLSVEKFVYKQLQHKKELFLIISCLIYACSLIILGLGATGNRLLVLLPFLTLLTGLFIRQIFVSRYKRFIIIFLFSLFLLQLAETANFVIAKLVSSPEETSSIWIQKHIAKGSEIGIENIPIYQSLPDVVLKEFYEEQNKISSRYMYQVIDAHTLKLPHFVIITDYQFDTEYLRDSVKKDLLQRLQKEHYRIVAQFSPYHGLYTVLGNELNYRLAGLTMTRPITIYEKR